MKMPPTYVRLPGAKEGTPKSSVFIIVQSGKNVKREERRATRAVFDAAGNALLSADNADNGGMDAEQAEQRQLESKERLRATATFPFFIFS
jgi:hypothetical protein